MKMKQENEEGKSRLNISKSMKKWGLKEHL
jgi:hypothetical protein